MQVDRPDAVAISSAMTALSLALNWERALTLFHRLPPRKRDVVCYGAAMTAAAAGKHWELALFWLYEMKPDKHSRILFRIVSRIFGSCWNSLFFRSRSWRSVSCYSTCCCIVQICWNITESVWNWGPGTPGLAKSRGFEPIFKVTDKRMVCFNLFQGCEPYLPRFLPLFPIQHHPTFPEKRPSELSGPAMQWRPIWSLTTRPSTRAKRAFNGTVRSPCCKSWPAQRSEWRNMEKYTLDPLV